MEQITMNIKQLYIFQLQHESVYMQEVVLKNTIQFMEI